MVNGLVATAITVYGIETHCGMYEELLRELLKLQQQLPFTVLKPILVNPFY